MQVNVEKPSQLLSNLKSFRADSQGQAVIQREGNLSRTIKSTQNTLIIINQYPRCVSARYQLISSHLQSSPVTPELDLLPWCWISFGAH